MSNLRNMLMMLAMRKDDTLMGSEFCDIDGSVIQTTLANNEILCWKQLSKLENSITIKSTNNTIIEFELDNSVRYMYYQIESSSHNSFKNSLIYGNATSGARTEPSKLTDNGFSYIYAYGKWYGTYRPWGRVYNLTAGEEFIYKLNSFDVSEMFKNCDYVPNTETAFVSMFHSEGSNRLGFTESTSTPIPVIVHNGNLHYALTDEVRAYASSFSTADHDVLAELNEYCCNHKDIIPYINKWKYLIHSICTTGYTSWLKGNGISCIKLGDGIVYGNSVINLLFNAKGNTLRTILGFKNTNSSYSLSFGSSTMAFYYYDKSTAIFSCPWGVANRNTNIYATLGSDVLIKASEEYSASSEAKEFSCSEFWIFSAKGRQSNLLPFDGLISYVDIDTPDVINLKLVPYFDTKRLCFCMLDIENAQLYYNADQSGSAFSWSLTDSDNNDIVSVSDDVIEYASLYMDEYQAPSTLQFLCADRPGINTYLNGWKYLLHSLTNTGWTNWLKGDGDAVIDTGIVPTTQDKLQWKVKIEEITGNTVFFGMRESGVWNSGTYNQIYLAKNKTGYSFSYNSVPADRLFVRTVKKGDVYNENVNLSEFYFPSDTTFTREYAIFTYNNKGELFSYISKNSISNISINEHIFVPCYCGEEYCMLDIYAVAEFKNKNSVGSFSWILNRRYGNEILTDCRFYYNYTGTLTGSLSENSIGKLQVKEGQKVSIYTNINNADCMAGCYYKSDTGESVLYKLSGSSIFELSEFVVPYNGEIYFNCKTTVSDNFYIEITDPACLSSE